jgi:hypothetical protein
MWKFYIFSPVANTAERSTPAAETDEPTKDLVQVLSYNEHCEYSHFLKFQRFKSICSWPITGLRGLTCARYWTTQTLKSGFEFWARNICNSVFLCVVLCKPKHKYCNWSISTMLNFGKQSKAVPLHAMVALGGRGSIAPTHSWPQH